MFSTSHIRNRNILYTALCVICIGAGCADVTDNQIPVHETPPSQNDEPALADGCKRLYLSLTDGTDVPTASVIVNGKSYLPKYNQARGEWFVDVEMSAFDVYSAELVQEGSLIWYGGTPNSDIYTVSPVYA